MEKVVYSEDTIFDPPTGAPLYSHMQGLRDELDRMELERDNVLMLLQEVAEAEGPEEVEEVITRVREFIENFTVLDTY